MRSRRSITTALALTLALCAIGAPVAFGGARAKTDTRPGPGEQDPPRAGATVVRVSEPDGFDWADAGVGVAGGVALSILGVGLVLLVSERRGQLSSRSSAETRSRSRPST
jgi:hypothetical protein